MYTKLGRMVKNVFRWSLIAGRLPGRTDNEVKNYWNSHLRKKLMNMGIDPNNHRLCHTLPRPQNPQNSASATSSGLKSQAKQPPEKSDVDNEQVSDAGSCLEDEPCSALPDLNLDLTMSVPSPSIGVVQEKEKDNETNISRELQLPPSPTLFLFK